MPNIKKQPVQPIQYASNALEACLISSSGSMQAQLQRSADKGTLPTCRAPEACMLSLPGRVCSCASSARWRQGSTSRRCPSRVCAQSTREKLARLTPFSTCKHSTHLPPGPCQYHERCVAQRLSVSGTLDMSTTRFNCRAGIPLLPLWVNVLQRLMQMSTAAAPNADEHSCSQNQHDRLPVLCQSLLLIKAVPADTQHTCLAHDAQDNRAGGHAGQGSHTTLRLSLSCMLAGLMMPASDHRPAAECQRRRDHRCCHIGRSPGWSWKPCGSDSSPSSGCT